mgnify:CR=1 FL=1
MKSATFTWLARSAKSRSLWSVDKSPPSLHVKCLNRNPRRMHAAAHTPSNWSELYTTANITCFES